MFFTLKMAKLLNFTSERNSGKTFIFAKSFYLKLQMTRIFTLLVFFLCFIFSLKAQQRSQKDTIRQLQEVVVTYQADKLTPITFQNLSAPFLKAKSIGQEPSFLLSETPSVTVYSDAGNTQGYSYFRMRGIDQTRINMMLDGVPINEPEDQGAYFSNYPDIFNSVSKIQVQRGVGTSKNGVASYGGSIQLFSPNLYDSTYATVGLSYGSFNSLRAFGEYNSGIKNKKAMYVRASEIYSDGYKYHSSNHSQSVFVSSGLFYDKTTWKLNLLAGHQQNGLAWLGVADSLIAVDRRINANPAAEKDNFTQCLAQLQSHAQFNDFSSLESSIYYTFLKGNYGFDLNSFLGFPSTDELYNYAFRSNLVGFFSNYTFSKNNFNWTSGIHGNTYNRRHTGSEKTAGQLYVNNGYKNEISLFTKADYKINCFTIFADIQYRYASFDYKGSVALDKMSWHFLNPKAGLSFEVKPNAVFYYSIGSTGREPTRNDMFGGNDDLLADSTGNALISVKSPEYVIDHELGFRKTSANLSFNLNAYYMDFQNEIVLDGKFGPNGLALTNKVERSFRTGAEAGITYKLNTNFTLINNSSFNYSRIKEQKEIFTPILTPPLIINQEVVYAKGSFLMSLSGRYQGSSFIDFANETTLKSYVLLNARLQYRKNGFEATLFLNNLTNTHYFNNGYVEYDGSKKLFVQAPFNTCLSLKYSF
jgi:iron complex outermembrane receptor protein